MSNCTIPKHWIDGKHVSVCTRCGAHKDTRGGLCYGCVTEDEAAGCFKRGSHEFGEPIPGKPFYGRCVWCDAPDPRVHPVAS
jgi:hypothetical protein